MFSSSDSMRSVLDSYILTRDLAENSEDYYRRIYSAFVTWHGKEPLVSDFTAETISRFLLDKQRAGKSSYYRKSLRNGLRALLGHTRGDNCGRIRSVKLDRLEPEAWTPAEVAQLIAAVDSLAEHRRNYWRTLIMAAYYTGLSQCDLHRVERRDFRPDGLLKFSRSKTGNLVIAAIPKQVIKELSKRPSVGPLWPLTTSAEAFRKMFNKVVRKAGLTGTFKKLRKTCGTLVELANPGRGHEVLANSRQIFERHYLDRNNVVGAPLMPAALAIEAQAK